jgi:hypothetical protein
MFTKFTMVAGLCALSLLAVDSSVSPAAAKTKLERKCDAEYLKCRRTKPRGVKDQDNRERCISHKNTCLLG